MTIDVKGRESNLYKFHVVLRRRKRQSHKSEAQLQGLGFLAIGLSALDGCDGFHGIECDGEDVCIVDIEVAIFRAEVQFLRSLAYILLFIRKAYTNQRRLGVLRPSDDAVLCSLWERAVIAKKFKGLAVDVSEFNGVGSRQTAVLRRMVDLWNDQKGRSAQREGAGGRKRPEQHDVNQGSVMVQTKEKEKKQCSEGCDICEMLSRLWCGMLCCGIIVAGVE